jgi:tripartite-type tricarboxylate transporter receptor subunit TctC
LPSLLQRRTAIVQALLAVTIGALAFGARAADDAWPSRPIHIVVPYPAGGIADRVAREVAQGMQESLKQTVVVDNRPGAAGNIGMDFVARQPADGYTIVLAPASNLTVNAVLFSKLPYDVDRDFAPLSLLISTPQVLLVSPSLPVNTVQDLINYSKANPGKLNYAEPGVGSFGHLAAELLKTNSGADMTGIPYQGAAPAVTDLMAGQVQVMFNEVVTAAAYVKSGRVKPLAVASKNRAPWLPDVPTVSEPGQRGFEVSSWYAMMARKGTPQPVLDTLSAEMQRIMKTPEMKKRYDDIGAFAIGSTPAELSTLIKSETVKWSAVVKRANITLN